jgi:chromosome segregation ATPase
MSQELIAYLDEHFRENSRQIAEIRQQLAETNGQIADLRQENTREFVSLRQEIADLRQENTREFVSLRQEIADVRQEVEDKARQTLIVLEGLRHEVHIIAEGYLGLHDIVKRFQTEQMSFDQFKVWIEPYFGNLKRRIEALEGWAERQNWDVTDAVRKLLGKPPLPPQVPAE